jgi:hypothetical protein
MSESAEHKLKKIWMKQNGVEMSKVSDIGHFHRNVFIVGQMKNAFGLRKHVDETKNVLRP